MVLYLFLFAAFASATSVSAASDVEETVVSMPAELATALEDAPVVVPALEEAPADFVEEEVTASEVEAVAEEVTAAVEEVAAPALPTQTRPRRSAQ